MMKKKQNYLSWLALILSILLFLAWLAALLGWINRDANLLTLLTAIILIISSTLHLRNQQ